MRVFRWVVASSFIARIWLCILICCCFEYCSNFIYLFFFQCTNILSFYLIFFCSPRFQKWVLVSWCALAALWWSEWRSRTVRPIRYFRLWQPPRDITTRFIAFVHLGSWVWTFLLIYSLIYSFIFSCDRFQLLFAIVVTRIQEVLPPWFDEFRSKSFLVFIIMFSDCYRGLYFKVEVLIMGLGLGIIMGFHGISKWMGSPLQRLW